ncbi:MAG: class I SAM-dependent methyltransferase [Gemmatimonadetes bacterium]|nr:class I SAM-dependent methyltransferase [Gemmatimonadota bacterium]
MSEKSDPIAQGHYAAKQIFSRSWLIAWSHRRRFEMALEIARRFDAARVLDYGCGDGTFLALLMRGTSPPRHAVGAEITPDLVTDCRTRLGGIPNLSFVLISELEQPEHRGAYDMVSCMEVLEHVVRIDEVLDQLTALLAPGGRLLISVPVETGLPLLVKQTVRRIAGWRGIGHYPGTTPYTWSELAAGVFAGARPHVRRVQHRAADGSTFHDHKGFNWMVLREKLASRLALEWMGASPVRWLPPQLSSQVWFVGKRVESVESRGKSETTPPSP